MFGGRLALSGLLLRATEVDNAGEEAAQRHNQIQVPIAAHHFRETSKWTLKII